VPQGRFITQHAPVDRGSRLRFQAPLSSRLARLLVLSFLGELHRHYTFYIHSCLYSFCYHDRFVCLHRLWRHPLSSFLDSLLLATVVCVLSKLSVRQSQ
jgi:hypothetical protein